MMGKQANASDNDGIARYMLIKDSDDGKTGYFPDQISLMWV